MKNPDNEYPTHEQIEEMFLAYKRDGQNGIREVLRKRRQEREDALAGNQTSSDSHTAE